MREWQKRLARRLEAARGKRPVDLVLKGGKVVNVFSGELSRTAVAVFDGVVVGFGDRPAHERHDLDGALLCPGFIDGHLHLESSLLLPAEFARAVLPQGTTTVVADPHEIANVAGIDGVQFLLQATEAIGLEVYFMAPSCVPATPLETSGARLDAVELERLAKHPRVLGLGEMMNYPGVVRGNGEILDKLESFKDGIVDGHAPGLHGRELDAYLCAGIDSDHECTRLAEAGEKLAKGMYIMIREGSQARDLEALAPLVTPATASRCMLVSDDCHPEDLRDSGHMNRLLNRAMDLGIEPLLAVRLVTYNPAHYFGLRSLGAIAPGFQADIVVAESLQPLKIKRVYKKGNLVAAEGRCLLPRVAKTDVSELRSMNLEELKAEDFRIPVQGSRLRAIRVSAGTLVTDIEILPVTPCRGEVVSDPERDLLKAAVFERHRGTGRRGLGFVRGFGLRRGALASTVAHDSHNLIVVGVDDSDMALAANSLRQVGGGLVVVSDGRVRARLPLPVAGLMAAASLEEVVGWKNDLNHAAQALGVALEQPFMILAFLALPVIPRLKLTDQGLVDVERFAHVPLFL